MELAETIEITLGHSTIDPVGIVDWKEVSQLIASLFTSHDQIHDDDPDSDTYGLYLDLYSIPSGF